MYHCFGGSELKTGSFHGMFVLLLTVFTIKKNCLDSKMKSKVTSVYQEMNKGNLQSKILLIPDRNTLYLINI